MMSPWQRTTDEGTSMGRDLGHRLAVAFLLLLAAYGPAAGANPQGVAVIIGNKTYQDQVPPVEFAHRDALAMKRYVVDVLGFREDNVILLEDATKAKMEATFGNERNFQGNLWRYLDPKGGSDVVVYYSGHGVPGQKDATAYLLPTDADPNQPEINGYPLELLYKNLGQLEFRSMTVYLDACFSGSSQGGTLVRSASPVYVKAEPPKTSDKLTVVTAAQANQLASWDKQARLGLFTENLLQGLYGEADKQPYGNGDGQVTLAEIDAYLKDSLTRAARRQFGRIQEASVQGPAERVLVAFPSGKPPTRPQMKDEEPKAAQPTPPPAATPVPEPKVAVVPPPAPQPPVTQPPAVALTAASLVGVWQGDHGVTAYLDGRGYRIVENGQQSEFGSYAVQGNFLNTVDNSGQRRSYQVQLQGNLMLIQDQQSGLLLRFTRIATAVPPAGPAVAPPAPRFNLAGVWQTEDQTMVVRMDNYRFETYTFGNMTDTGTYAVQGTTLTSRSVSGMVYVYQIQQQGNSLTVRDASGRVFKMRRIQ